MPLSDDARKYCHTLFDEESADLRKRCDAEEARIWQNLTNREDAAKRAGYIGTFQARFDYLLALGHAQAMALRGGYEYDKQPLTELVIEEIMEDVRQTLAQSAAPIVATEKDRLETRSKRIGQPDPTASAKLDNLSMNINRVVNNALKAVRNSLTTQMYKARINGEQRTAPDILHQDLVQARFESGDAKLNELLEEARNEFLAGRPEVRREGLERLWDAWERLKTLQGGDKKHSIAALLSQAASEPKFRFVLDREANALTDIGNRFFIRHTEVDQTPIETDTQVDYLFHRMFALIQLLLRTRPVKES